MKANHAQFLVVFMHDNENEDVSKLKVKIQLSLMNEFDIFVEFFENMNEVGEYLVSFVKV
jgi:hypothetical protein